MGGHIGDGNFHSMMVYRSEEEHAKVDEACRRLVQRAIELDGTCTYPIELDETYMLQLLITSV